MQTVGLADESAPRVSPRTTVEGDEQISRFAVAVLPFAAHRRCMDNYQPRFRRPTPTVRAQPIPPVLLTVADAARALAIGRTTMYELIRDGSIPVIHIGRSTRVPVDAVRAFASQQQTAP